MLVYVCDINGIKYVGKANSESEINCKIYSIVAFCKTVEEQDIIYKLYAKDLKEVTDKNEVSKK